MATISYTWAVDSDSGGNPIHIVSWTPLVGSTSDVGVAFKGAFLADKSVQLLGTLGTFFLEGSNDGTNFALLHTPGGTAIDETGGARLAQILENTRYIRPRVSGAASGVTVTLVGRLSKV